MEFLNKVLDIVCLMCFSKQYIPSVVLIPIRQIKQYFRKFSKPLSSTLEIIDYPSLNIDFTFGILIDNFRNLKNEPGQII
jgi:hypothetical protein